MLVVGVQRARHRSLKKAGTLWTGGSCSLTAVSLTIISLPKNSFEITRMVTRLSPAVVMPAPPKPIPWGWWGGVSSLAQWAGDCEPTLYPRARKSKDWVVFTPKGKKILFKRDTGVCKGMFYINLRTNKVGLVWVILQRADHDWAPLEQTFQANCESKWPSKLSDCCWWREKC